MNLRFKALVWLNRGVMVAAIFVALATLVSIVSEAGTYNFYFNDSGKPEEPAAPKVETAQPVVVAPPPAVPAVVAEPAPASPPVQTAPAAPNAVVGTVESPRPQRERGFGVLRLGISGSLTFEDTRYLSSDTGYGYDYTTKPAYMGVMLSAGLNLSRAVNLNAFAAYNKGVRFGAETELYFLHIDSSVQADFFEAGLLLGASSYVAAPGNPVSLHTGLRFNVNINNNMGVAVTGRVNLGFIGAETGLVFRI